MINGRPRRIHLKKTSDPQYEEGRAGGHILPGYILALGNDGRYRGDTHANGPIETIVAIEDALSGSPGGGGRGIDDAYESGSLVRMILPLRGDHCLLVMEPGTNAKVGDHLISNGTGMVQVDNSDSDFIAVALEDRDATDSDATLEDRRIRARIR